MAKRSITNSVKNLFRGKQMPKKSIEDTLKDAFSGDSLKNALDFIAYLKTNELSPDSTYPNSFNYLGESVCVICTFDEAFGKKLESPVPVIFFNGDDVCEPKNFPVDANLKEFAQANVHFCAYFTSNGKECGCKDRPGRSIAIFGKEFNNVCHSPLWVFNPDTEALENIKKLVEIWKHNIAGKHQTA